MIIYSPISAGCLLLFVISLVAAHPSSLDQIPDDRDEEKQVKKTFAQLLNNIVKVNEDRLKAMKSLSRLQGIAVDGNPLNGHPALRSGFDDEGRSDGGSKSDGEGNRIDFEKLTLVVFENDNSLLLRNANPSKVKNEYQINDLEPYTSLQQTKKPLRNSKNKKKKPPSDEKSVETDLVSKQKLQALRAKWRKSCDKAAAKNCTKACKAAYRQSCDEYRCKKRLRRAFKRNCKRMCKERFRYDDYDDD